VALDWPKSSRNSWRESRNRPSKSWKPAGQVRRSAECGYSTAETNEETASQIPHHSATEVSREMLQAAAGLRSELLRCTRCCDTRA
jgi:hypothetical protein